MREEYDITKLNPRKNPYVGKQKRQVTINISEEAATEEAGMMSEAVRILFKEELDEARKKSRQEGRKEGREEILCALVKDGFLPASEAAKRLNMTESEFLKLSGQYVAH